MDGWDRHLGNDPDSDLYPDPDPENDHENDHDDDHDLDSDHDADDDDFDDPDVVRFVKKAGISIGAPSR